LGSRPRDRRRQGPRPSRHLAAHCPHLRRRAVMSAEIPRLSIEDGYLVARVDRCTCDPHYGAHEIHCGIVDHQRLDDLPGWPGASDRPSVTGAARAALAVALAKYEAKVERAQNSGQGTVIAILAGASLAHAVRDA